MLWSHLHCARTYDRCAGISDKEVITVSQGYAYLGGGLKIKSCFGSISKGQMIQFDHESNAEYERMTEVMDSSWF